MRNILFYSSYYEAIKELPNDIQGKAYKAIIDYAMTGIEPNLKGIEKTVFILVKPSLDSQIKNYENGIKGGRPRNPNNNPNETESITQIKPNENPNNNPNETDPVTKKENNKENIKKEINKEKNTVLTDSELLSLIEKNFSDNDIRKKFTEYAEMRKEMGKNKAIRTRATFESCVKKLRDLASSPQEAITILNHSILNCYQGLFAIHEREGKKKQQEVIPYAN